jgi:hypothetical protein
MLKIAETQFPILDLMLLRIDRLKKKSFRASLKRVVGPPPHTMSNLGILSLQQGIVLKSFRKSLAASLMQISSGHSMLRF